jgi:hypothetical protein
MKQSNKENGKNESLHQKNVLPNKNNGRLFWKPLAVRMAA